MKYFYIFIGIAALVVIGYVWYIVKDATEDKKSRFEWL